ncbi:zinc finger protein 91-like, partial [Culicoides brevitarsis]|uniref:zinc finger protein 91-like n=1 Tax=Culicoides brevitarsis TaxID=469753 RepID=UPI00307C400B
FAPCTLSVRWKNDKSGLIELSRSCRSNLFLERHIKEIHEKIVVAKCEKCKKPFSNSDLYKNHLKQHEKKPFSCNQDLCFKMFQTKIDLVNHVKTIHKVYDILLEEAEKFSCDYCKKSFHQRNILKNHLEIHRSELIKDHPDSKKCKYCSRYFFKEDLRKHYLEKHKPQKCEECGKVLFNVTSYRNHQKLHDGPKFTCDICGQVAAKKGTLETHIIYVHLKNGPQSKCELCDKMIMNRSMKKHIQRVHDKILKYECIICKKGFSQSRDLRDHLALKHLEQELYKCSICDKSFSTKGSLKNHVQIHESEKIKDHPDSRKCKYCSKFVLKENLKEHLLKQHKERTCEECGKIYFNEKSFHEHKETHKGPKFTCDLCGKKSFTKSIIQNHMIHVHLKNVPRSKCEICDKKIKTSDMQRHIQIVHERNYKIKCVICEKGFQTSTKLRDHLALQHLEEELHKCSICDNSYSSKASLKAHLRMMHEKIIVAKCEKCGKEYTNLGNYKKHLKTHEQNPFSCDKCFRMCESEKALKEHLAKRHYNCDKCGKVFMDRKYFRKHVKNLVPYGRKTDQLDALRDQKGCLKSHMEVHLNELIKDHPDSKKCKYCSRYFFKEDLRKHYLEKHKPQKCEECGMVLFNAASYRNHQKIHDGPKFTCDICGYVATRKSHLENHMRSMHLKNISRSQCKFCDKMILDDCMKRHVEITHERAFKLRSFSFDTFTAKTSQMLNL